MTPSSTFYERALSRIFQRTLRWASAGTALVAGCGEPANAERDGAAQTRDGLVPSCDEAGVWRPLTGFRPAMEWDYLSQRSRHYPLEPAVVSVLDERGEVCGGGSHIAPCTAEVEAAMTGAEDAFGPFLLGTHLDDVRVFAGMDAVDLFGTVDTLDEALWLIHVQRIGLRICDPLHALRASTDATGNFTIVGHVSLAGDRCPAVQDLRVDAQQTYAISSAGEVTLVQSTSESTAGNCPTPGRRPAGLLSEPRRQDQESLGALFAREAHAEAASIFAFDQLAHELSAHRAPASLWQAALRARADEQLHARLIGRLALRLGARPLRARVAAPAVRPLAEIALLNAVEGCVRETYSALRAAHQARCAQNRQIGRVMARIARDELRHASLSWQVADWAERRLSPCDVRRVREARRQALYRLRDEVEQVASEDAQREAGMPSPAQESALVHKLSQELGELASAC